MCTCLPLRDCCCCTRTAGEDHRLRIPDYCCCCFSAEEKISQPLPKSQNQLQNQSGRQEDTSKSTSPRYAPGEGNTIAIATLEWTRSIKAPAANHSALYHTGGILVFCQTDCNCSLCASAPSEVQVRLRTENVSHAGLNLTSHRSRSSARITTNTAAMYRYFAHDSPSVDLRPAAHVMCGELHVTAVA